MNPDGTQDVNLRAWLGPGPDGASNNGTSLDERGLDTPAQPYQGGPYTAPLKFTRGYQAQGKLMQFGIVHCGSENVADINDGSSVLISADKWLIQGSKYGFTCKGASYADVTGEVVGFGSECDFDFGNYSDQRPRGKAGGKLNLWRADRSPIRVRVLQGNKPELVPGSGPYVFLQPDPDAWWHDLFIEWFLFARRNRLAYT